MKAAELTAAARALIAESNRKLGSSRFPAGALLLRQALEQALDGFWARSVPTMASVTSRAQLISVPFYLDAPLAETSPTPGTASRPPATTTRTSSRRRPASSTTWRRSSRSW